MTEGLKLLRSLLPQEPKPVFRPLTYYERRSAHRGLLRNSSQTAQRRTCKG